MLALITCADVLSFIVHQQIVKSCKKGYDNGDMAFEISEFNAWPRWYVATM